MTTNAREVGLKFHTYVTRYYENYWSYVNLDLFYAVLRQIFFTTKITAKTEKLLKHDMVNILLA